MPTDNIPAIAPTLDMKSQRVRQTYPGFNAQQIRTVLNNLGIEPPARLPNSGQAWVCNFPNIKALLLGCISLSVSQYERINNKPCYQIEVVRFATPLPDEAAE